MGSHRSWSVQTSMRRKANRVGYRMTDYQETAEQVTGDPAVRKFILDAFHKLDTSVTGPIPVAESVSDQLQVIQNLSEKDSGRFLTHHGGTTTWDNTTWF